MNPFWTTITFLFLIPVTGSQIRCDALHQLYVLKPEGSILKYDSAGNLLHSYHQNAYGKNAGLDAGNPLQLLVSFPDYATMVLLDNTLSEITTFHLNQTGIIHFSAACLSQKDDNIWIFDDHDLKIKRMNRRQQIVWQSDDMISVTGKAITPVHMLEQDEKLYLDDPENGIFVFDLYGHWLQTIPVYHTNHFEMENRVLIYAGKNTISQYMAGFAKPITLPDSLHFNDYCFCGNKFLVIGDQSIHVFSLH